MILWQKKDTIPDCRIAIAGDFLPASGLRLPEGRSWTDLGSGFAKCFRGADVAILNLECCLDTGSRQPSPKFGLGDSFSASRDVLDFPVAAGVKLIGMANNHVFDFGDGGAAQTRKAILNRSLIPIGIGRTLSETPDVHIAETCTGLRVGFWAAARHLVDLATRKRPGIEPATRKRGETALNELKEQGAATTIAYLHAGMEHTNRPDPDDVALMDDLVRIGFDLVTACHSHRISGYKGIPRRRAHPAFCFYGLGSISSGVLYSDLEREGLVIVAGLDKSGEIVRMDIWPVHLEQSGWGQIPDTADSCIILDRFLHLSEEIAQGTYRERFYREIRTNLFQKQFRDFQAAMRNGGIRGLASKLCRIRMRHLNRVFHQGLG
jgi:poly-gamma-glutamate capsule biosynthesis protein CapA/YwtB (metallophosphatase superfamily)